MKFYVWGSGPAQSRLIAEGEYSTAAVEAAQAHDFKFESEDDWAVEVEVEDEEDIDKATRFDKSVVGYTEYNS